MKRLILLLQFTIVPVLLFAQDASDISALDADLSGAEGYVIRIAKGLCGIGACIGLINIARKSMTENGQAAGEIIKWALLITLSVGVFATLHVLFN